MFYRTYFGECRIMTNDVCKAFCIFKSTEMYYQKYTKRGICRQIPHTNVILFYMFGNVCFSCLAHENW